MQTESSDRRGFRVVGRVQGVGFRWWTRRLAEGLSVSGWVRNEADGSVLVHAMGSTDALGQLEAALRRGPPGGRVDRLEAVTPDRTLRLGRFRIEK